MRTQTRAIRVGPARMPSRESPEKAIEVVLERGYAACEVDFESGFWMDYPFAERLGELAGENDVALSVHAPLFGFMGHLEAEGRKYTSAVGALDRSAGIAAASGAELVVLHLHEVGAEEDARGLAAQERVVGILGARGVHGLERTWEDVARPVLLVGLLFGRARAFR